MIDGTWKERRKAALGHLSTARKLAKMGDRECALHLAWASDCGPDVLSSAEMQSVTKAFQEARREGVAPTDQGTGGWFHRVEATGGPRKADLPKAQGKVPPKGRSKQAPAVPARPVLVPAVPAGVAPPAGGDAERLAQWAGGTLLVTSLCEWIEGIDQAQGKKLEGDGFRWSAKRSAWWREIPGYQREKKTA